MSKQQFKIGQTYRWQNAKSENFNIAVGTYIGSEKDKDLDELVYIFKSRSLSGVFFKIPAPFLKRYEFTCN